MRADKFYDSYERKVTDILTLLGDVGGLKEFFLIVGELIVGFFAEKLFISSILKKIYHMRKYENIEHESKKHDGGTPRRRLSARALNGPDYNNLAEGDEETQKMKGGFSSVMPAKMKGKIQPFEGTVPEHALTAE